MAPTPGTVGNSGTGILFGPSKWFFDLGIYKSFQLTEALRLQFRAEAFNAFNHPNLQDPVTLANSAFFGRILTKDLTPRVFQFALRLDF